MGGARRTQKRGQDAARGGRQHLLHDGDAVGRGGLVVGSVGHGGDVYLESVRGKWLKSQRRERAGVGMFGRWGGDSGRGKREGWTLYRD